MLVLSRKVEESVSLTITEEGLTELLCEARSTGAPVLLCQVKVVQLRGPVVRLGFEAPSIVHVLRDEIRSAEDHPTCQ